MTFIVGKKHMNSPNLIAITCFTLLALSGNGLSAIAAETQPANKTFGDWCREKASLSPEARHSVEVMLRKQGLLSAMRLIRNFQVLQN